MTRRGVLCFLVPYLSRAQDVVFSTDVQLVNILATVRDAHRHIIANLNKEDFILVDDGRPQEIKYFVRQTDLPLRLSILIDISGSQHDLIGAERKATRRFVTRVLREQQDLVSLIRFAGKVEILQTPTGSKAALENALDALDRPMRRGAVRPGVPTLGKDAPEEGTALYDAILAAAERFSGERQSRKAVIVLTDGCDNASKASLPETLSAALQTDTLAYAIRFADENSGLLGKPGFGQKGTAVSANRDCANVMGLISSDTGGAQYESRHSLDDVFDQIEQELRNQYSFGYTPTQRAGPGEFREIRLTCVQKGLKVRTRKGYYGART